MSTHTPAEVFPPGEYIRDELEARGWTQQDLAQILERPLNAVNQIISGKRGITPETAKGLAAAFGTSPEFWMNLENAYLLAKAETNDAEVAHRAKLFSVAPVNEMIRRGWIEQGNIASIEGQLKSFFGATDLDHIPAFGVAARKSTSYSETTIPQRAWCYRAKQLARTVKADAFDEKKIARELLSIRLLTPHPENIRKLPVLLASWGIRLVLVAHLEKTKIDGATLWLDERSPVIALSLRFDRIDYFWHTLTHEIIHVKNLDSSIDSDLMADAKGQGGTSSVDEKERSVNTEAASCLVPQDKLEGFIIRHSPLYAREKIVRFGQANEVHPGIVLGQLHYRQEVPPKNLRDLLVPVRHLIVGQTITDGWGHKPGIF